MSDPQQDYADALGAYKTALARLQEAKRHIPPTPRDRHKQRVREKRAAETAYYLAHKEQHDESNQLLVKAIADLHNKCNQITAELGPSLRIRLPVQYRIVKDDNT